MASIEGAGYRGEDAARRQKKAVDRWQLTAYSSGYSSSHDAESAGKNERRMLNEKEKRITKDEQSNDE